MQEDRHDAWVRDQREAAEAYVDGLLEMSDKLAKLGPTEADAHVNTALAQIEDALPLDIAPTLSALQHKAAVMLGKGISFGEVERELGMAPGELYQVHQRLPEFRRAKEYYENVDKEEAGGLARQWLRIMLSDPELEDKTRASLLALAHKIGEGPGKMRMELIDRHLRKEQIDATREMTARPGRLMGVTETEAVDADFEVEETDSDDGDGADIDDDLPEEDEV